METNNTPTTTETNNTPEIKWLTPYQVHKLANVVLRSEGLTEIKPQMVYNYVKNNLIPATNGRITKTNADKWVAKYVANRKARLAEAAETASA